MKIPVWNEEEKKQMLKEWFMINKQSDVAFIMKNCPEKLPEYTQNYNTLYGKLIQRYVKPTALGWVMFEAMMRKNLMDSEVEVEGDDNEATLTIKRDGFLMTAVGLAENNILRVKKEVFQQSCIEGYFKPRAASLGLKVIEAVPLEEGYRIKVRKE